MRRSKTRSIRVFTLVGGLAVLILGGAVANAIVTGWAH